VTAVERLYVSDLDGTLLGSDGRLSDFSRRELHRLLDSGLPFTVASARAVSSIQGVLPDLPLPLPVISANGAVLARLDTGEQMAVHSLDGDVLPTLYAAVCERGHVPFVAAVDGPDERLYYAELPNDGMRQYVEMKRANHDRRLRQANDLAECLDRGVVALALCDRREPLEETAALVAERFPEAVVTNFFEDGYARGWFWLAMQNPRARKDLAIAALAEEQGVEAADLVVFGDDWNDIPMFRRAGTAIAVANAAEELKAHADAVIGSNDEDSVVRHVRACWSEEMPACR
jgi:hypothetical protein